jgi:hypothetical protein
MKRPFSNIEILSGHKSAKNERVSDISYSVTVLETLKSSSAQDTIRS